MSKKNNYKPRGFETVGENKLSSTLFYPMLQSKAFKSLTNNAKVLYIYMKLQLYGQKKVVDPEGLERDCFYFNRVMFIKGGNNKNSYELYSNCGQFERDLKQLIEYGFIEIVQGGKNTRTKSIYCFSAKWKTYG